MKDLRHMERILKPLANKRRLAALRNIKQRGEATVGDVAAELKLSIQATSRHLQILSKADIVESDQRRTSVFYRISKMQHPSIKALIDLL